MKKEKIEIGQKVFIITRECNIEEKEVFAIINTKDKLGYTLEENSCGGYSEDDVFITKAKAQVKLQNFLDELKFKVGDLIVFEYKKYSSQKKKAIGRIIKIVYSNVPYEIRGSCKEFDSISEEEIFLKIKNEFIENYGNIQELYKEFNEKKEEVREIIDLIHGQFDNLETEINDNVRKQYGIFNWNKSKPLFKDRFTYEEDDNYYD